MREEEAPAGALCAIWVKRAKHGGKMDPRERSTLVAGKGLAGNADQGGWRQVTLIEQEAWAAACAELGADLPPTHRRANLMLAGVSLERTRRRILQIGACRLRILGETVPCHLMDQAHPGLKAALRPHWRGGVFAEVLTGGEIAVGDPVAWEDDRQLALPIS